MKKHIGFITFFGFVMFMLMGKQILMKEAMLRGDFLAQFYPWMKVYAESIKEFTFPFWSRYFHSGFPLMAEGQIGGFYPLNILMFFLLPFKIAYNYSVILHFVMAGCFSYVYARKIGADQWGGALAALLFCFGSAYAGAFYNIVTLRTLIWFPLVLLLFEYFINNKKFHYIIIAGIVVGTQFLAGFIQLAAYSFVFYIVYMICSFYYKHVPLKKSILAIFVFSLLAIIVGSPQLLLTYNLVQATARASSSLGFALWGSFPLISLPNIIFPKWMGFLGQRLFIGVFSLIFLLYGVIYHRKNHAIKVLMVVGILAFFAALGKYNPLYVALLKITGFYSFRNPSKFLFFTIFCASIISGVGFSKFFTEFNSKRIKVAAKVLCIITASSIALFFAAKVFLIIFKDRIIALLRSYTLKHVYGKPHHRYSLDIYMEKVKGIYQSALGSISLSDFFIIFSLIMVFIVLIMCIYIYKNPGKVKRLRIPIFCLIFIDLYAYSFYGTGFTNNISFNTARPKEGNVLSVLRSDDELFRILPFDLTNDNMSFWVRPNANILVNVDSVAAYTPLAEESYTKHLSGLEVVDSSLGVLEPSEKSLENRYQAIRLLNVKYVVSTRRLDNRLLKTVTRDKGLFLYEITDYLPRIFFTTDIKGIIAADKNVNIKLIEYKDGYCELNIDIAKDGFLIFSENYYPGWSVYADEEPRNLLEINGLVQGVFLKTGAHRVVFKYKPNFGIKI